MDRKIRRQRNKREGKFTVDYSRVGYWKAIRFGLLGQLNASHELFLMVNAAIDMYQSRPVGGQGRNLATDQGY
mgnify:CR=1 FL=1